MVELEFKGKELLIQTDMIPTENGGQIPLNLFCRKSEDGSGNYYEAEIDGVSWFTTKGQVHAVILYTMLKKHVNEYMHYKSMPGALN